MDIKVINFPKEDPDVILEEAKGIFQNISICGWDTNGDLYFISSEDTANTVFLLMKVVKELMEDEDYG